MASIVSGDFMLDIVSHRGFQNQVGSAAAAHLVWKKRLLAIIENGESDWTPEQVESCNLCEFGQWLDSVPDQFHDETYRAVHDAHVRFHQCAAQALGKALSENKDAARAAVSPQSEYFISSVRLISALAKWQALLDG